MGVKITPQKYRFPRVILWLMAGAILGFFGGYFLKPTVVSGNSQAIRDHGTEYRFIHPLLAVGRSDMDIPSQQYVPLARSIQKFIDNQKAKGNLDTASVYFINYDKGGSIMLNGDQAYAPASLLKVVIMVAYLKKGDTNPEVLNARLVYEPSLAQALEKVPFDSPSNLVVGHAYDVGSLIDSMIIDSDNGAMNLLLANIDDAYLNHVYADLGLKTPSTDSSYTISAKEYSLFFRILYNGTYLSDASSEKALSILSKATFADGLVAGLPPGTVVAHKFGEHVNGSDGHVDSMELHDCGIVYDTRGSYLLCVMTKGKDLNTLKQTIAQISELVHNSVTGK